MVVRLKDAKQNRQATGPGRYVFIAAGIMSMAVGTVGVVVPILPTTPFYLLAAMCLAKGSRKLHGWFLSTKLYKKHLEGFVQKRAMSWKAKLSIIGAVTVVMGLGFIMMSRVPIGRIVLTVIWATHVLYFVCRVNTSKS